LPNLAALAGLRAADFRAYLAERAGRGNERSSMARGMSVLRGFLRFSRATRVAADERARGLARTQAAAHGAEDVQHRDARLHRRGRRAQRTATEGKRECRGARPSSRLRPAPDEALD